MSGRPGVCLLVLSLALAGCYTYRPLPATPPAAGTRVRVALTDPGSDSLASRIGPGVVVLEGPVTGADSAGLALGVSESENRRGVRTAWQGETVVVPARYILHVEARQLSWGGTGLLGGAVAAGLVGVTAAFAGGGLDGGAPGPGNSGGQ